MKSKILVFLFSLFLILQTNAMELDCKRSGDPLDEYFKKNEMSELLANIWHPLVQLPIDYLSECVDCKLTRGAGTCFRDAFENKLLKLFDNSDILEKISKSKYLVITDFGAGGLFQAFVIVGKILDKLFANKKFNFDGLNVCVNAIDPAYSDGLLVQKVFGDFYAYFENTYKYHNKINLRLFNICDANDFEFRKTNPGFIHIVTCVDFDRFEQGEKSYIKAKINTPEEFIEKLYNQLKIGDDFYYYSLTKYGLTSEKGKYWPCIFWGKFDNSKLLKWAECIKDKKINATCFHKESFEDSFSTKICLQDCLHKI